VLTGNLILCEPTIAAREAAAAKVAAETGACFVPPYDFGPVIAGQGTIGLELLQQVRYARYTAVHPCMHGAAAWWFTAHAADS
jgi:threonine dehydratase